MRKISIVATDIDGTFVTSNRDVPHENKRLVEKVKAMGKHVLVSTGRAHVEAIPMFDKLGIKCAKVCSNGGVVVDEHGEIIDSSPLDRENVKKCIKVLEKEDDVYFEVYANKNCIALDYRNKVFKTKCDVTAGYLEPVEDRVDTIEKRAEIGELALVDSFDEVLADSSTEFYKIIIVSNDLDKLRELDEMFSVDPEVCVTSSEPCNREVNSKHATKGNALKNYAKKFGYDICELMAIGDSYNDISMFEVAGVAVAMGNAPEDIKEMCDWVTESNNDGGWASAVEKFVLKEELVAK